MPIFPFFQYPYNINRYYPRHNYYSQRNNNLPNTNVIKNNPNSNINKDNQYTKKEKSSRYSSFGHIYFQNPLSIDSDQPVLEILGISLYLDDLIILGLLFFLYKEQVQDEMLFLILILLLLT